MELAIIAPVLFLLILAIMEGGRVFSAWLIITNEAREGARYGVVRYNPGTGAMPVGEVQARVRNRIGSQLDPSSLAVDVQQTGQPALVVRVDYRVDIITPLVQSILPNPFPLRAVSVMRAEE